MWKGQCGCLEFIGTNNCQKQMINPEKFNNVLQKIMTDSVKFILIQLNKRL